MFERGTSGDITQAVLRYAPVNNKYMGNRFNPGKESSYLQYLNANNLYSWTMNQNLPMGSSRNTFQEKMFQDLKNSIYHPVFTIFGGIKDKDGFNPKLLTFRDFSVLSVIELAKIFCKLQRQFCNDKHQL